MKIIPIFIPHAGCPYRCIYCDQHKISGAAKIPSEEEIKSVIERNLKTISKSERVEAAFFGGTFTLLPVPLQEKYLETLYPYVKNKKISGIRMSTHPEAVSPENMKIFKSKGGCLVELGVQSLDEKVLKKSKRAMDFSVIKNARRIIKKSGLDFGVQVMIGLPSDTLEKSIKTAEKLIGLKPKTARIYPVIVIKGTELGELYKKGGYKPLSFKDAIEWSARVADTFERGGVKVIRIGLHPSEDLNSKGTILSGPYHQSFGEMARSRQIRNKIMAALGQKKIPNRSLIEIAAPKKFFSLISGHKSAEKMYLEKYYGARIILRASPEKITVSDKRKTIAIIDPKMPGKAKIRLKNMGYYIAETPLHPKLARPVRGHPDMLLFCYGGKVIYEPRLEYIATLLRDNGYECIKGEKIASSKYPKDIIYDAAVAGKFIIRYKGKIEKHIKRLNAKFINVRQGYAKCSIVPVDRESIITSDNSIKDAWKKSLLVRPGHIKLPGYKTGFIGGASGVDGNRVFFIGSLDTHPDGELIRKFIESRGKQVIDLYKGKLYDAGTIFFLRNYTNKQYLFV